MAADAASIPLSRRERAALAAMAIAPAVFLPGALNRFVFPKAAVAALACALAGFSPARGRFPRAATWIVVAGAAALAVAAGLSASPQGAFLGRAPREEGAFVLATYVASAVAGSRLLGPARRRGAVPWWLRWLAVATIAIAVEALLETAGLRPLASNVARPGSLLGNASDEGALGVLVLGPFAGAAITTRDRWCIAGTVAAAATVVLSASRGALVGVVPFAGALALALSLRRADDTASSRAEPRARRRPIGLAIGSGLAAVAVAAFALPFTRSRILGQSPLSATTVSGRGLLWRETLHLVASHWYGVGPSGFVDAIGVEHDRSWQVHYGPAFPPDSPHNWLLQAASAGGVVLAGLAVALAGLVLWRGWKATADQPSQGERGAVAGLLAGLVGYGTTLLFHLTSPGTTPLAAFFAGALLALPPAGGRSPGGRPGTRSADQWHSWVLGGGSACLCVVLALAAFAEIPLRLAVDDIEAGKVTAASGAFGLARALRPWDAGIDATAGHAFAVAADDTSGVAERRLLTVARPWVMTELAAYPHSVQALEDAATLDQLSGSLAPAAGLLARAAALDHLDPDVLRDEGIVAIEQKRFAFAQGVLAQSASIAPGDAVTWQELARADTALGHAKEAAAAERRATRLARPHR